MLTFERPDLLFLGLFLSVVCWLILRKRRPAVSAPVSLGPPGAAPFAPPVGVGAVLRVARLLEAAGVIALVIAAAGPISVVEETVWLGRGADVLFVLDSSPSMSARDMDGKSRFETAKRLIRDFVARRGADAVGLVGVGASAALLVPPTVDRRAFSDRLDSLSIAEFGDGTALGTGLSIAALHLRSSLAPRRAAILLTDGENNAGEIHPATAAAALRSVGASLWVIGVGSAGQVPIDYVDPETGARRTGVLDSRFDEDSLKAIAQAGGGSYLSAPSASALTDAFAHFSDAEATPVASRTSSRVRPLYPPVVLVGAVALVLGRLLRRLFLGALL